MGVHPATSSDEPSAGMCSGVRTSAKEVRLYYQDKTQFLIERYGPGPVICYALGLFDEVVETAGSADQTRERLVAAQTRLLDLDSEVWGDADFFTGAVLDIGCGLGGPAIYWAQRFDVRVTAVTLVAEHAGLIRRFAAQAGVADRVEPVVADFRQVTLDDEPFHAAVALESACYIPRDELFRRAARALEPGGYFGIEDVFVGQDRWKAPFDAYWKTEIGSLAEYVDAAEMAGFTLDRNVDVTHRITEFWIHSAAWAEQTLATPTLSVDKQQRLIRSIREHARLYRCFRERGMEDRILRFRRR